jgi:hypothetical protein
MNRIVISALVVIHLVASVWHGDAHTKLAIELPPEKRFFVFAVILIAPIVSAVLVWTRFAPIGLWMFFCSMLGALLFGAYHHYVLVSPDNIGHLPGGNPAFHSQFISSAAVIALLELTAALFGACCLGAHYAKARARG